MAGRCGARWPLLCVLMSTAPVALGFNGMPRTTVNIKNADGTTLEGEDFLMKVTAGYVAGETYTARLNVRGQMCKVSWTQMNLRGGGRGAGCPDDYVELRDVADSANNIRVCGTSLPATVDWLGGDAIDVVFHSTSVSDGTSRAEGFLNCVPAYVGKYQAPTALGDAEVNVCKKVVPAEACEFIRGTFEPAEGVAACFGTLDVSKASMCQQLRTLPVWWVYPWPQPCNAPVGERCGPIDGSGSDVESCKGEGVPAHYCEALRHSACIEQAIGACLHADSSRTWNECSQLSSLSATVLKPDCALPATPAPATPSPLTSAPPTPAPVTPAPASTWRPPTPAPATPSPLTSAPPTPAPVTSTPISPAPATPAPATPSPLTSAPPTPAPVTSTPISPAPATTAPATPTPATRAPSTPAPPAALPVSTEDEGLNETVFDRFVKHTELHKAGVVVAALGATMGYGTMSAARLYVIAIPCGAAYSQKEMFDWPMSPLGLELWGSRAAGAMVGNASVVAAFALTAFAVAMAANTLGRAAAPRLFYELDAQGFTRFPSAPLMAVQVLYQGLTLGAMTVLFAGPSEDAVVPFVVAVVCLVACVALPLRIFATVVHSVPTLATVRLDPEPRDEFASVFLGPGEWVSKARRVDWIARYASVVRSYAPHCPWFLVIEFGASLAISAAHALLMASPVLATTIAEEVPLTWVACGHVKAASAVILLVLLRLETVLWPHLHSRNGVADCVILSLQAAAAMILAAAYYSKNTDNTFFSIASALLMAAVVFLCLRTVVDVAVWLYVAATGRRRALQLAQYEETFGVYTAGRVCAAEYPDSSEQAPQHEAEEDVPMADGDADELGLLDTGDRSLFLPEDLQNTHSTGLTASPPIRSLPHRPSDSFVPESSLIRLNSSPCLAPSSAEAPSAKPLRRASHAAAVDALSRSLISHFPRRMSVPHGRTSPPRRSPAPTPTSKRTGLGGGRGSQRR